MKFSELQFVPHHMIPGGRHASVDFPNGYGASVVSGSLFDTDDEHPYKLAVIKDNALTYDTPITSDVIGHLNEAQVEALLAEIAALPVA